MSLKKAGLSKTPQKNQVSVSLALFVEENFSDSFEEKTNLKANYMFSSLWLLGRCLAMVLPGFTIISCNGEL
jgi:hypothetical protein